MACMYTEDDVLKIKERILNKVIVDEDGCEIWDGYMTEFNRPVMHHVCENNVKRLISVPRFIWTQSSGIYDYRRQEIVKSCQKDRCLNLDHFSLNAKNKSSDHDHVWELILAKTTVNTNGCFVSRSKNVTGYSSSRLNGVAMSTHKIAYIIRNNKGRPLPKYDEHGEPLVIRHTCNERSCVNPKHLKLGTRFETSPDGVKSNDDFRREIRTKARLAKEQVWTDRDFIDAGEKIKQNVVESSEGKSGEMPNGLCWIWQLSKNAQGYGNVTVKRWTRRAHILSCEVKYGRRAKEGEIVRHLCSNPPCVNPEHLVFGSPKDNSRDSLLFGKSKNLKFTPDSVRHVRASKKTNAELAEEYGVHRRAIYNIRTRRTWSSVE